MRKIKYMMYNNDEKLKRVVGIYVGNNVIANNKTARCYVFPCEQNSTYTISRSAITSRNLIGVVREYPSANTDIVVSGYNMGSNLSIDVSTRDGKYIVIYYAINTTATDNVKWSITKSDKIVNIFNGFEIGDYDFQTGNAVDKSSRIRSVAEEKVKIDIGTYTIEFNDKLTIGTRLYEGDKFYKTISQTDNSGKLTFKVDKPVYIKLIAETTTLSTIATLTKEGVN